MPRFQLVGHIKALHEYRVEYLIVGGVGARIQGAATTTQDLDMMPEPSGENLGRLAAALSGASTEKKPATATEYTPHPVVDAMEFRTETISSFRPEYGLIDVLMELPGVGTYDEVRRRAKRYAFEDVVLVVADLDDIISSKESASRAKDWRAMDALHEARDRLRERPDPYELTDESLDVERPLGGEDHP